MQSRKKLVVIDVQNDFVTGRESGHEGGAGDTAAAYREGESVRWGDSDDEGYP